MSENANSISNAKSLPQVFFGLHFAPGLAEYPEPKGEPTRILINEETSKKMDPSFRGRPVYVEHVDKVDLENLQHEADGYVVRSFYNAADGNHWAEFIVVSDEGKEAIQQGWTLSNAYIPKTYTNGGLWHGVEYSRQLTSGEYEHLAIVQNPRYEESIILTPENFKKYNEDKQDALKRLANSKDNKGEKTMGLNFFKRSKVENAIDLESTMVELPKSKKEMKISELVERMDKIENMHGYANDDHMVKCGNDEMSVKDLVKKHMAACNELEEMKKPKEENELPEEHADMPKDEMNNAEDEDEKKEKEESKKNAILKAKALKNAGPLSPVAPKQTIDLMSDKLARGRELF